MGEPENAMRIGEICVQAQSGFAVGDRALIVAGVDA